MAWVLWWDGVIETISGITNAWQPERCKTEKDFENSLLKKLQEELKDQRIQSQYGSGAQRVDIVIDKNIAIEIKKDLKNTSVLQRLIGQMELYIKDWEYLFIILCGNIKPDLLKDLKSYIENKNSELGCIFNDRVVLLIKN
ncbi:MAG: hypothetical protein WC614_07655 [bacterium]